MRARAAAVLSACMAAAGFAAAGPARVSVGRGENGAYKITGGFEARAPASVAWSVLTDYEGLGKFVSSIRSSRVLKRTAHGAVLEQTGAARFLFVSRQVTLTLAVEETPQSRLDFKDADGRQFDRYEGSWTIAPSSAGCRVDYELTALPGPTLGPRFAVKSALKSGARGQLDGVRAEIERRAAAAKL